MSVPDGDLKIGTALVKNASAADALAFIQARSAGKTALTGAAEIGDEGVMYFDPATESGGASVTVRFTVNTIAAKVQVFAGSDDSRSDADLQAELSPVAVALAQAQATRLQDFLANTLAPVEDSPSMTSSALITLSGTTLVGRIPVTENEWLGVTGEYEEDANISGLADAALSRFSVTDRPEEVVEVTVLDFYVKDIAPEYAAQLITDDNRDTQLELPSDLPDTDRALATDTLIEAQLVKGNYVIDISVFSPFGVIDRDVATQDLVNWARDINLTFESSNTVVPTNAAPDNEPED
jgi:hypothetical protein